MVIDENVMYLMLYDMQCWIRHSFVIKQPVQKKPTNKKTKKNIDWVYIKVIDHRIQDQMDKMCMNQPLECVEYQRDSWIFTSI